MGFSGGAPDRRRRYARQKSDVGLWLALARELGHSFQLANGLYWAAQLFQYRRDRGRTRSLADEVIALSADEGARP